MDFDQKIKELEEEKEKQLELINRSQDVISACSKRLYEIKGELKIINEIKNFKGKK